MIQVERHNITGTKQIIELCKNSKDLYNRCNYLFRQAYLNNKRLPDLSFLINEMKKENCYKNLHNTKTAKQTIRKLLTDWTNYFKSLRAYNKDYTKFVKKPKPPGYKKKLAQVIFDNETIKGGRSEKRSLLNKIIPTNDCFEINSERVYKQVIRTPKQFGFIIDVSYENEIQQTKTIKKTDSVLNIDLGVNNLCTITSDKHSPIIINGRIPKTINQWFNKSNKNKHNNQKRYWRFENYFHHTSKLIIDDCVKYGISTIIIGKNDGWKKGIRMNKKNKQNFFFIPFNNLINKIQYKAAIAGIEVKIIEESYTSKASFLDRDVIPEYKKMKKGEKKIVHEFSGRRIKRGLYQIKDGILINADCNGSGNIGRKIIQNEEILLRLDRSVAATPVIVNPLRLLRSTLSISEYHWDNCDGL